MFSFTKDAALFSYDYKEDLARTAIERDRLFVLSKIREDTVGSDDESYFIKEEQPEDKLKIKMDMKNPNPPKAKKELNA